MPPHMGAGRKKKMDIKREHHQPPPPPRPFPHPPQWTHVQPSRRRCRSSAFPLLPSK